MSDIATSREEGLERLATLATHLESGVLGHKWFDFSDWNFGNGSFHGCGTSGCAIGECPIVFPEHWEFSAKIDAPHISPHFPLLRGCESVRDSSMHFFSITEIEFHFLFLPQESRSPWNNFTLYGEATRFQVARGIRNFIACAKAKLQKEETT